MENSSSGSPEAAAAAASAAKVEYVGFWKRFVAFLIDSFIIMVIIVPLMIALYGMQYFDLQAQASGGRGLVDWLVNIALVIATLVFWRYRGATPGKMAISAKIVDARTHAAPSTGTLVVRFFAYFVSTLPLCLGFAWIGIDRKKQGFHDKIAGTVVIYDDED
ncbi:MAG: RDD family protein [Clostridia bacterium]